MDIVLLLVLLGAIVWACSLFTNAIEWLGHKGNLSSGAVGSVLAAVGTALPETLVPIVALVGGALAQNATAASVAATQDIGIGAILGAPFMIGTLAMAISGLAVIIFAKGFKSRSMEMTFDAEQFFRDLVYFFIAFAVVVGAAFLPAQGWASAPWVKPTIGVGLLALYGLYVYQTLNDTSKNEEAAAHELDTNHLEPLWFAPKSQNPSWLVVSLQTVGGLGAILVFAHQFVHLIEHLAHVWHVQPLLLSLLIIPIATELPEKFNSVMWLKVKKDTLAMGNLTGAMVFQSCIPGAIGVCFTPWQLQGLPLWSVVLCVASSVAITLGIRYLPKPWWPWVLLVAGGSAYATFVVMVLGKL
jgi:cation:H+ antiporter